MHLDSSCNQAGARKAGRILLIAAVPSLPVHRHGICRRSLFHLYPRPGREGNLPDSTGDDSESGYLEWSDAKLVLTFPAVAESREIEFRPAWLPFDLPEELPGSAPWNGIDKDTWFRRWLPSPCAGSQRPKTSIRKNTGTSVSRS